MMPEVSDTDIPPIDRLWIDPCSFAFQIGVVKEGFGFFNRVEINASYLDLGFKD